MFLRRLCLLLVALLYLPLVLFAKVSSGLDVFFDTKRHLRLQGKKVGLITNHTAIDKNYCSAYERFLSESKGLYRLAAIFSPEHGLNGNVWAEKPIETIEIKSIPIHSLYGKTRRPTKTMLKNIDVLIFDMQEIGSRSYTYLTTLFYCMEEAAKEHIPLIVLDRPNPINGITIDGPMLENKWRSYIGYVNVPYCHGMTVGEIANFFNQEYQIKCDLEIVEMKGWKRDMDFSKTELSWIPTSPNIPEPDTPYYYSSTGLLGAMSIVSIGVGYTMPFKIVGAPWIKGEPFAQALNAQKLKGVRFIPFHFTPFYGLYKAERCEGVYIKITDKKKYKPLTVQFLLMGMLKSLYPDEFNKRFKQFSEPAKKIFCQANGTDKILLLLTQEKYPAWKLIEFDKEKRKQFAEKRKKYLIKSYE